MTTSYRNKFTAYKQETDGQYAPIGSITPFLVDSFSTGAVYDGGAGTGGEDPEFAYKRYLYCDGKELLIRDYPELYNCIGNTYGGDAEVNPTQPSNAGGLKKLYYLNGKAFININRDIGIQGPTKLPYPYGCQFRFIDNTGDGGNGLGAMPTPLFELNKFYKTKLPTEDLTGLVAVDGTEFAYEVDFADGTTVNSFTTVNFTSGNHPNAFFRKSYNLRDYPYQIGTFKLPDYRDRIIAGLGAVDNLGSPTIENALVNNVGQVGGRWFISNTDLLDGGAFFTVGDVRTTGYSNITADILTFMTGSVEFRIGPVDDYIFSRPVEHFHYILSSEPDEGFEAEFGSSPSDQYAVMYSKSRSNILPFEPDGSGGLALGHSHGLSKDPLNNPRMATYGNVKGIGGEDPNVPADVNYDVNDPVIASTASFSGVSLENYGTGSGEIGGFSEPAVTDKGDKYLAFGYNSTGTFGATLQGSRSATYTMDFTGYNQFYIFAIGGNDSNGGERTNNVGEGLQVTFSDGTTEEIIPSGQDFNAANSISGGFDQYDAVYAYWTQSFVTIPSGLQTAGQTVTISQTCANASGGNELQAGNEGDANALDMFGIQALGLRGGIPSIPPDPNGTYPVTGSPTVSVQSAVWDAALGYVILTTSTPHGFDAGSTIEVQGANQAEYNGAFEVLGDQLSATVVTYVPDSAPTSSPATGLMTAKLAVGSFIEETSTPDPRAYVIDAATTIGGKLDTFEDPGTGTTFSNDEISSPGTINTSPYVLQGGENFSQIDISLVAPGGGGADTTNNGGDAGYAYATFNWKGTNQTIYAYGGDGATRGNQGGAGGAGGTFLIPQVLIDDPDFTYSATNGSPGQNGGGAGTDTSNISGGGASGNSGSGGDGKSESSTVTNNGSYQTYNSNGSWTAPAPAAGEQSRTVTVRAAGGGGGGGNGNGNSNCNNSANGGTGGAGALVTATMTQNPSSLSWTLGQGGKAGFNNIDGNINGTGSEANQTGGGGGASNGGNGGRGAWGNGATAGSAGGSTGVYFNQGTAFLGAGGGGSGGGSGGGFNGGGTTDGCYAGGNHRAANTNLHTVSTAMDFVNGSDGTSGGCTAGGGGGGGGAAGPAGSASGGEAGQAGVGHNGNGGGTGGKRGDSCVRTTYANASWSTAGNGGSPGSGGGNGYVQIKVDTTILVYGSPGGGGGQGATIVCSLIDQNIGISAGLQSVGGGGGDGTNGVNGSVIVTYRGSEGGGTVVGETTSPAGRYYNCNVNGFPGGSFYTANIWQESTADGDTTANEVTPQNPGLGTNSSNKFAMPAGAGAPTYGGLATKYIAFNGAGTRQYILASFNMSNVNKIRFTCIKGTNLNGGAVPEEDLIAYWKPAGSNTTNVLDTIITAGDLGTGWVEKEVILAEGTAIRNANSVDLIIRQTRNAGQDDNSVASEDNYGISMMTFFYDEVTTKTFVPSDGNTISDVDFLDYDIGVVQAGLAAEDGNFLMSSSTPISTTALVVPENNIPLITKYHRVKYLIKAY